MPRLLTVKRTNITTTRQTHGCSIGYLLRLDTLQLLVQEGRSCCIDIGHSDRIQTSSSTHLHNQTTLPLLPFFLVPLKLTEALPLLSYTLCRLTHTEYEQPPHPAIISPVPQPCLRLSSILGRHDTDRALSDLVDLPQLLRLRPLGRPSSTLLRRNNSWLPSVAATTFQDALFSPRQHLRRHRWRLRAAPDPPPSLPDESPTPGTALPQRVPGRHPFALEVTDTRHCRGDTEHGPDQTRHRR